MKIINKAINLVGKMLKGLIKWFKDAGMELIAQAFTLLGFFIASCSKQQITNLKMSLFTGRQEGSGPIIILGLFIATAYKKEADDIVIDIVMYNYSRSRSSSGSSSEWRK
jgi:hypothetical protein